MAARGGKGIQADKRRSRTQRRRGQGSASQATSILVGGELAMPGPKHGRERRPSEPARFDQARQEAQCREHRQGRRAFGIGDAPGWRAWRHGCRHRVGAKEGRRAARVARPGGLRSALHAHCAARHALREGRIFSPDAFGSERVEAASRPIEGVGPEGLSWGRGWGTVVWIVLAEATLLHSPVQLIDCHPREGGDPEPSAPCSDKASNPRVRGDDIDALRRAHRNVAARQSISTAAIPCARLHFRSRASQNRPRRTREYCDRADARRRGRGVAC